MGQLDSEISETEEKIESEALEIEEQLNQGIDFEAVITQINLSADSPLSINIALPEVQKQIEELFEEYEPDVRGEIAIYFDEKDE